LKATRLNSFKIKLENFYATYSRIFRTHLVYVCKYCIIMSFSGGGWFSYGVVHLYEYYLLKLEHSILIVQLYVTMTTMHDI